MQWKSILNVTIDKFYKENALLLRLKKRREKNAIFKDDKIANAISIYKNVKLHFNILVFHLYDLIHL